MAQYHNTDFFILICQRGDWSSGDVVICCYGDHELTTVICKAVRLPWERNDDLPPPDKRLKSIIIIVSRSGQHILQWKRGGHLREIMESFQPSYFPNVQYL